MRRSSPAKVENGELVTDFEPYEVKTFALKLKAPSHQGNKAVSKPVKLDYTEKNTHIPKRLLPEEIAVDGTVFKTQNAYALCSGQTINIEKGNKLKLLCAATLDEDITAKFIVDGKEVYKTVNAMEKPFAQWDLYDFKEMAYVKSGHLGYEFTHSVDDNGKTRFAKGLYFWMLTFDGSVTLPDNPDIVILSAAEINSTNASLATPMYDEVPEREFTFSMTLLEKIRYLNSKCVWMLNDKDNFIRHWNNGKNGRRVEQTKKNLKSRTVETVGH